MRTAKFADLFTLRLRNYLNFGLYNMIKIILHVGNGIDVVSGSLMSGAAAEPDSLCLLAWQ